MRSKIYYNSQIRQKKKEKPIYSPRSPGIRVENKKVIDKRTERSNLLFNKALEESIKEYIKNIKILMHLSIKTQTHLSSQ